VDPKQFMLAHFEKIALGVAALWLAAVGAFFASEPAELAQNNKLGGQMATIAKHFKKAKPDPIKKPDWATALKTNLAPDRVEAATPFPSWVIDQRPVFLYGVEAVAQGHKAHHEPPVDLALDSSNRGRVSLSWQASVQNEYVVITHYLVERKIGEGGDWKQIAEIDGVEESYGDAKVQSRTEYHYRITSVSEIDRDNPVVDSENMTLAKKDEKKTGSEKGPITISQNVYLIPTNGDPVTPKEEVAGQDQKNEWAYVEVYKWLDGKFEKKAFRVKRGGKIGKLVRKGRGVKIDFATGATLEDVAYKKIAGKQAGHMREVLWIQYKFADGTLAEATEKDTLPDEVKGN
jgi:hypothetical protein